jgi:hypothetical protein
MPTSPDGHSAGRPQPLGGGRRLTPRHVAVVSDGSALGFTGRDLSPASLIPLLDDDAAYIHERIGLPVRTAALSARTSADLAAQIYALRADAGAVFLTHTDSDRARNAQRGLRDASAPPVLTDADASAITITTALINALAQAGHSLSSSRVVIAGAARLPELSPLLITTGIGDISSWNQRDARAFPLHHLARYATAVIDLLGATAGIGAASDWEGPIVISPNHPGYRLLPVPGLLHALASHPGASLDVDVSWASAHALASATPPDRLVPDMADSAPARAVTSAALRMLAERFSTRPQRDASLE